LLLSSSIHCANLSLLLVRRAFVDENPLVSRMEDGFGENPGPEGYRSQPNEHARSKRTIFLEGSAEPKQSTVKILNQQFGLPLWVTPW
jgi:hypothetical protein